MPTTCLSQRIIASAHPLLLHSKLQGFAYSPDVGDEAFTLGDIVAQFGKYTAMLLFCSVCRSLKDAGVSPADVLARLKPGTTIRMQVRTGVATSAPGSAPGLTPGTWLDSWLDTWHLA